MADTESQKNAHENSQCANLGYTFPVLLMQFFFLLFWSQIWSCHYPKRLHIKKT